MKCLFKPEEGGKMVPQALQVKDDAPDNLEKSSLESIKLLHLSTIKHS